MTTKNTFTSKWVKGALACVLAIIIAFASSAGTYFLIENNMEKPRNIEELREPLAFSKIVSDLKQQAHDAIFTPHYPERGDAITSVGEKLKEILSSEYAELVTNDTFNSDEFQVNSSVYPLKDDGIIKRITFVMINSENDIPYEESHFFLQYLGDTTFFSDIEYLRADEKDFYVFEQKNNTFMFSLYSGPDYSADASDRDLTAYFADIYLLDDAEFSAKKDIRIPLKIDPEEEIQLIQQDGLIKIFARSINNEQLEGTQGYQFDSVTLSFESPSANIIGEPIDYELPGLLLGLSDSEGNLRTLFIRKEDNKIRCNEYTGQVIFPRKNKLFSLKRYALNGAIEASDDEGGTYSIGNLDIQKILCAPLGADRTADFKKIFYPKPEEGYYDFSDIPLYVGSEYVCYIQDRSYSGGGSYHGSISEIRFDKFDNLSKFTSEYEFGYDILTPKFTAKTLADLVYRAKAKEMYQSDVHTYGNTLNPYIDFKQLAIKRNLGKWSLMLPIMDDYYHPGNGSHGSWIKHFVAYSNEIPTFLASNEEAVELEGDWSTWDAKDLLKFPDSSAILTQFDYYIGIGKQDDIKIPVKIDEYIVSINFSDNKTQKSWTDELNTLKP